MTKYPNEYDVDIIVRGRYKIRVCGKNFDEAERKALSICRDDDFGPLNDIEFDVSEIYEQ